MFRVENPSRALLVQGRGPCPVHQSLRIERALGPSCPLHSHGFDILMTDAFVSNFGTCIALHEFS